MSSRIVITIIVEECPDDVTTGLGFRLSDVKKGKHHMLAALKPGQVANGTIFPTVKGKQGTATLSAISYDSTDTTVFTVDVDPAVPNGFIITGVGSGSATSAKIEAKATATETDGRVNQVSGSDDVTCELAPPPADATDGIGFQLTLQAPPPPNVP